MCRLQARLLQFTARQTRFNTPSFAICTTSSVRVCCVTVHGIYPSLCSALYERRLSTHSVAALERNERLTLEIPGCAQALLTSFCQMSTYQITDFTFLNKNTAVFVYPHRFSDFGALLPFAGKGVCTTNAEQCWKGLKA